MATKAFAHENLKDGKDEWLTPPEIIKSLGEFDLDPCAPVTRPWDTAKVHFSVHDDGLNKGWDGRVWCNPPYKGANKWIERCKNHGNCILLIFARTETRMWFEHIWNDADAILFIKGRLTFYHVDGSKPNYSGGAPSCLVAYGKNNVEALKHSLTSGLIKGKLIVLK
jgi:phage N-6-adenine-methyltransferase